MTDNGYVKIVVDLPNHFAVGGESMWARDLGGDRYELENVPFYAYDLNYHDVVRAVSARPELKPEIREVVERSGHRTLRVVFFDRTDEGVRATDEERRLQIVGSFGDLSTSFERAKRHYFALDVAPGGDYEAVRDRLDALAAEGLLQYETCEARAPGSFDDVPQDDADASAETHG